METIFAQIAADAWAVDPKDVFVSLADTSLIQYGYGTVASRSTLNMGGAIHYASERLRDKVFKLAGHALECSPDDLELRDGGVCIKGVPGASVSLAKVAQLARPGWNSGRPADIDPGLEETYYYETPKITWACAAHAAVVDVDIKTGRVNTEKYVIVHECGVVVNPMLVEGQMVGAAVQGLGGTLLEEFDYDADGQLLAGSMMDYMIPTASDVPNFEAIHVDGRSALNPLGVKGAGEGGTIAAPPAIANAISDALAPFKVEFNTTPITPEKIVHTMGLV
jgi:carbon-monoxide dehydrogenase large subunit